MKTIEDLDNEIKELRCTIGALQLLVNGFLNSQHPQITCDHCGCHPTVLYTTETGTFCKDCKPLSNP